MRLLIGILVLLSVFVMALPGSLLHDAVDSGTEADVLGLLRKGCDPNESVFYGTATITPLLLAVARDSVSLARLLLQNGANVNGGNGDGFSPLHMAVCKTNREMVKLLLSLKADVEKKGSQMAMNVMNVTSLYHASLTGSTDVMKMLLEYGAKVDVRSGFNNHLSALHVASTTNIVALLLGYGADINSRTGGQTIDTPLHCAIASGNTNVACFLTGKGAALYAKDNNGRTPLFLAIEKNQNDVVETIVKKGVNLKAVCGVFGQPGVTALAYARSKGNQEAVNILARAGAVE